MESNISSAFTLSLPPARCNWSDKNSLLGSVVFTVFLREVKFAKGLKILGATLGEIFCFHSFDLLSLDED